MQTVIIFTVIVFWVWALRLIAKRMEQLEKENRDLKISNKELLDANYKLSKK